MGNAEYKSNGQMRFSFSTVYRFLFCSIVILLTLGQLQRIQITPSIAVYIHEILMGIFITFSGLHYIFQQKRHGHSRVGGNPGLQVTVALPLEYILVQTLSWNIFNFQTLPLLYLARWSLYLGFFFSLLYGKKKKWFSQKEIYWSILMIGGGIAALGIVQYLIWPDTRWLYNFGWDDHYYRLISTLFDPGFTALIIILTTLFYLGTTRDLLSKYQRFLIVPFFLISILLTYSRAGYLAFLVGLLFLGITKKSSIFYILFSIFILAIPFLPRPAGEGVKLERTASIEQRIESNQTALQQLTPLSFLLGQGMYRDQEVSDNGIPQHAKGPDNSFVFLLTSFGIIGVFSFIPLSVEIVKRLITQPVLLACFIAWGAHSMFNLSLVYPWAIVMMSLLWTYASENEFKHRMS